MRFLLLCSALLLLVSGVVDAAEPASNSPSRQSLCLQDEKCRDHYANANELYKAGKLTAAVTEYEAAYAEIQLPVFLYNLGRIHHRLGNLNKAAGYYRKFLSATADEDPAQQARAKEYLSQIQQSEGAVAAVTPTTPAAPTAVVSAAEGPRLIPRGEQQPIYKKWWFWTIIGGVAAGATIGLAVGLASQSESGVPAGVLSYSPTF